MKTTIRQNRKKIGRRGNRALAVALTEGTRVTAPNELPVRTHIAELEPYVKEKKPSRSSTVYDRVE